MKLELIKNILNSNLTAEEKVELTLILLDKQDEQDKKEASAPTLKQTYFQLFDQLPEKVALQAKFNYDKEFATDRPNPATVREALEFGFAWGLSDQGVDYWSDIYKELKL